MAQIDTRTNRIAQAVSAAQQLANADDRVYLVARGARGERPLVEPLSGLEILSSFLVELMDAGRVLLVTPQGKYHDMTSAEIVVAESAR